VQAVVQHHERGNDEDNFHAPLLAASKGLVWRALIEGVSELRKTLEVGGRKKGLAEKKGC
jgi:hypothetical protein